MIKFLISTLGICILLGTYCCSKPAEPADLVLFNGKIVTVEESQSEVQAVAIKGDRILALGSDKMIKSHIADKTKTIDLKGQLAIPGLIDSHGHFTSLGYAKMRLDLTKAKN